MQLKGTFGGYEVLVEIDVTTGNVVVTGAPMVVVHFIGHHDDHGLIMERSADVSHNRHLSFRCCVADDKRSVVAQAVVGPTSPWPRSQCPQITIQANHPDTTSWIRVWAETQPGGEPIILKDSHWKE